MCESTAVETGSARQPAEGGLRQVRPPRPSVIPEKGLGGLESKVESRLESQRVEVKELTVSSAAQILMNHYPLTGGGKN